MAYVCGRRGSRGHGLASSRHRSIVDNAHGGKAWLEIDQLVDHQINCEQRKELQTSFSNPGWAYRQVSDSQRTYGIISRR